MIPGSFGTATASIVATVVFESIDRTEKVACDERIGSP